LWAAIQKVEGRELIISTVVIVILTEAMLVWMSHAGYVKHIHKTGSEVICFHLGELPYITPGG